MKKILLAVLISLIANSNANAEFVMNILGTSPTFGGLGIDHGAGPGIAPDNLPFNRVNDFRFTLNFSGDLVAGQTYNNPTLNSVDYRVFGQLPHSTPSGFPAFLLLRTIDGADFYSLSPEASINFTVSAGANLNDGLQVNELSGTGTVFTLNARELNQNPGRYHPPIFTLNADGTGELVSANNQSTFPNPPPPSGSGLLVDVAIGEEYRIPLTFDTSLSIVPAPEPTSALMLFSAIGFLAFRRQR